jgi:dipeptidyl aminopeptidase/acylaminoacyl peptidase
MKNAPILLLLALAFYLAPIQAQTLTVRQIMAEPSIAGMRVDGEKLSPDGTKVIYLWNAEGKLPRDLYFVSTSGGPASIILRTSDLPAPTRPPEKENKLDYGVTVRDEFVKERENQLGNFEWSPDSKKLLFSHGGDLYMLTLGEAKPRRLTRTQGGEGGGRFLDNDRILYSQSGNLFVWDITNSLITQISKEANPQNFVSVFGGVPNKPGTLIAYTVSDSSKQKALVVPNFIDEFVVANPTRRGWTEQKIMVVPADGSRDTPFEIKLPKPEGVSSFRVIKWAADDRSLIVDRIDKDTKRRQLFYIHNVGGKDEKVILVTEETDDKWQADLSRLIEPNPKDASELFFCSEKDGFNHIYLAKLEKRTTEPNPTGEIRQENPTDPSYSSDVKVTQLTKGNWQVEWAKWINEKQIVFASTQNVPAERQLDVVSLPDGLVSPLQRLEGMKTGFQLSESAEKRVVLFENSTWNQPGEFYSQQICFDCHSPIKIFKLTATTPESFKTMKWNEPAFLSVPTRDGKKVPAKVYLPAGYNARSKMKYPMVVFIHGAGYLQNIINGWNNYYREFMFNELLTQKGYVVLDIDYRGSAGYGRDWRTDVYDFLGGKDMDDHVDAIDYMVKNYSVNPAKVGVYGGSYGGFMAGMLITRAPDKVAAAAALRPVFDWKNYYASSPGYTAQRLGFPDKNPEAYKRSSPITYADKLERPLLILHGMSDDNVHVQDSIQMMEKLIRLGKTQYFETMLYPSENHGFVRPESWTDEYERILDFFEKHLK